MTNSNLSNLAPIMAEVIRGWMNEQPQPEQPQQIELTPNEAQQLADILNEYARETFSTDCLDDSHPMNRTNEARTVYSLIDRLSAIT